jgi:hypothetical protein
MAMNPNLSIDVPFIFDAANLDEQIAYGNGHVHVRFEVYGYWSDVVTLRVTREFDWRSEGRTAEWTVDVSHSSGGRESSVDNLVAERCFAKAIVAACDLGELLMSRAAEMEAAYQARQAAYTAERERIAAEKAEREAADPAIGDDAAKALVEKLVADARCTESTYTNIELSARTRGEDEQSRIKLVAQRDWNSKVLIRQNGQVTSRKEAIKLIASLARKGAKIGPQLNK